MRFEVGEMVRVAVAFNLGNQGRIAQIIGMTPADGTRWKAPDGQVWYSSKGVRYAIDLPSPKRELYSFAQEFQLAKIDPPAEPASLTRSKENEPSHS